MRLVYGVGIVVAKLVDYFLDILLLSLENGIPNDFFEPKIFSMSWLAGVHRSTLSRRCHLTVL